MKRISFTRKTARRVFATLVSISLSSLPLPSAHALEIVGAGANLGVSTRAAEVQASSEAVSDLIIGKNTRGPYVLSWKQISPDSDKISVDGVPLQRGVDYTVDCASGTIAFNRALKAGAIARVVYSRNLATSVRAEGGLNLPIELSLLNSGSTSLRFTGLYKEGANQPNTGTTIFGFAADRSLGDTSKLNTMFLMSSGPDKGQGSGFLDRSALRLGGTRTAGRLQFKSSYERTGEAFAGGKEYGVKTGMETMDFAAAFAAGKGLTLTNSFNRVTDIGGADKGSTKTLSEQKINYGNASGAALALTHRVDTKKAADGSEKTVSSNRIQASDKFGKSTTASASVAMTSTTLSSDPEKAAETTEANFQVQAADKLQVQGAYVGTTSEGAGESSSTKISINAKPVNTVNVKADYSHAASSLAGDLTAGGIHVKADPNKNLSVQVDLSGSDSSLAGIQTSKAVRVQAKATDALSVSAGFSAKTTADTDDVSKEARMVYQPGQWLKLGGGMLLHDVGNETLTNTDVNASLKPARFITMSGGYKDRRSSGAKDPLDTTAMAFALDTTKYLKLTGSYQRNPEDTATGQPLALGSTSLGLQTHLGILSLTGACSTKNDYAAGTQTSEKQFGFGVPLFGRGQLTTGVKLAQAQMGYDLRTTTYSLGYSHQIGSDFSLLLSGSMTEQERDQAAITGGPGFQAEAKVGMKF